jgi:hypothetical protein
MWSDLVRVGASTHSRGDLDVGGGGTMAGKKKKRPTTSGARIHLVASDDKAPSIRARPGVRIEMVDIVTEQGGPARIGARLCGYGSGSCLALVEIETE